MSRQAIVQPTPVRQDRKGRKLFPTAVGREGPVAVLFVADQPEPNYTENV